MKNIYLSVESRLLNIIRKQSPKKILDFGCGEGLFLHLLSLNFDDITLSAADIVLNESLCSFLQETNGITFFNLSDEIDRKELEKNKFDLIYSTFCLHHFNDSYKTILEIKNKLSKDGAVVFVDFLFDYENDRGISSFCSYFSEILEGINGQYHRHFYSENEAIELFKKAGFETIKFSKQIFKKQPAKDDKLELTLNINCESDSFLALKNYLEKLNNCCSRLSLETTIFILEARI